MADDRPSITTIADRDAKHPSRRRGHAIKLAADPKINKKGYVRRWGVEGRVDHNQLGRAEWCPSASTAAKDLHVACLPHRIARYEVITKY